MGLFGKKKTCSVCGKELGLFGKVKLADGLLCKECSEKLSPYFTSRRTSTVDQIVDQLEYRERNKDAVASFEPTRVLGTGTKVYVDERARKIAFSNKSGWREANPDVFDYDQISGCDWQVDEDRTELKRETEDHKRVSYDPPRYEYRYNFYVTVQINHPYVSSIRFKINQGTIERKGSVEYDSAERTTKEIHEALTQLREGVREANAPRRPVQCPNCMATTVPDASGCCEYCGAPLEL